jgi:hypothetical protein
MPPFASGRPDSEGCSNALVQGSYGFRVGGTIGPDGAPLAALIRANDFVSYAVNAECTGKILSSAGGGIFHFVILDEGKNFFLRKGPFPPAFASSVWPRGNRRQR